MDILLMNSVRTHKEFFIFIGLVGLAWEFFSRTSGYSALPSISAVLVEAFAMVCSQTFYSEALMPSLLRLTAALMISIPLAFGAAILCYLYRKFDRIFSSLIYTTFSIPKVALFPLFLVLFGIGSTSQVLLILTGSFYLLFSAIDLSFKRIAQSPLHDLTAVYQLRQRDIILNLLLKGSKLAFLTGMKAAVGYGLVLVVVSESTASVNGVGHYIWLAWDRFEVETLYASIFLLALVGFIFQTFFDFLIRKNLFKSL
jgi:NitT/TauT family transport system permease protein